MAQNIGKLILPFSLPSLNRKEPFTKEMERATIFCLAEMERAKGRGLVTKQPLEKLVFLAEVCHPLWLAPLGDTSLLFDGLNTTYYTLTYLTFPDAQTFLDNVNRSFKTRQTYMTFLSDNLNYFKVPDTEEKKVVHGLITEPEFLPQFTSYLSEAKPVKDTLRDVILISPTIDAASLLSMMQELQSLKSKFVGETNALYATMKLLNEKTRNLVKVLSNEMKEVKEKFNEEITKSKSSIAKKVDKIRGEYDEEVTSFSKKMDEKLLVLQQERIKLEKTKEHSIDEIKHCEAETKTCALIGDDFGEQKWKEERDKLKKQFSETEAKIKEFGKQIKDVEDEKKLNIFKLKSECNTKIKDVEKDLFEIESSRDARINIYKAEMEKLEELTSGSIIGQISNMAKLIEASIAEFDKLGIQQKRKKHVLIYIPFYLACYGIESRKRYACFTPFIANNISFSVKFKGILSGMKIKQLFKPHSKAIVSLLDKFPLVMEQNAVFDREINEACLKANMLHKKNLRDSIKAGLKALRKEDWLSDREYETFSKELA